MEQQSRAIKSRLKQLGFWLLMLSGCVFSTTILNGDMFYFLSNGAYLLQYGFPHELMFSVHAGEHFHYIMQQWLWCLLSALIYENFGFFGLIVCSYAIKVTFLTIFYYLLLFLSHGRRGLSFAETFLSGVFLIGLQLGRPYELTMCLLLIEIFFLQWLRVHPQSRKMGYVLFPLLSVLAINLQAAMWPMLLVFLLPYFFETTFGQCRFLSFHFDRTSAIPLRTLIAYAALVLIFALLNPYGIEMLSYGPKSYSVSSLRYLSMEMLPLYDQMPASAILFLLLFIYIIRKWVLHHLELPLLLLLLGTGVMVFMSLRSVILFFPCAMMTFTVLARTEGWFLWKRQREKRAMALLATCMMLYMVYFLSALPRNVALESWANGYVAIAEDASARGEEIGPVYAIGTIGSYLTFFDVPVYMYSCTEAFSQPINGKKDVLTEYHALQSEQVPYDAFLRSYGFRYVFVDDADILYDTLVSDDRYTLIYQFDRGFPFRGVRVYRCEAQQEDTSR